MKQTGQFTGRIWTVAVQTFSQCIRKRSVALIIAAVAIALALMPSLLEGDGTLAGKIQSYLRYSFSISGAILCLFAILITAELVSEDVRSRRIYTLVVKPLARWEYIFSRFLGVLGFNLMLLLIAAISIFFVTNSLRNSDAKHPYDRQKIETEIFTARNTILPNNIDINIATDQFLAKAEKDGRMDDGVEEIMRTRRIPKADAEEAYAQLKFSEIKQDMSKASPGGKMSWVFPNLSSIKSDTLVQDCKVVGITQDMMFGRPVWKCRLTATPSFIARMKRGEPIEIASVQSGESDENDARQAIVEGAGVGKIKGMRWFQIILEKSEENDVLIKNIKKDSYYRIKIQPIMHLKFVAKSISSVPVVDIYRELNFQRSDDSSMWRNTGYVISGSPQTIHFPVHDLDDNYLKIIYNNKAKQGRKSVTIQIERESVQLLYQASSFNENYIRIVSVWMLGVVLLTAFGVFLGSALSFAVSAFVGSSSVMFFWLTMWLGGQRSMVIDPRGLAYTPIEKILGVFMVKFMGFIFPGLEETAVTSKLIDGLYLTNSEIMSAIAMILLGTTIYLVLACVIFKNRELAASEE